MIKKFLVDFVIGGTAIALAVLIGMYVNPVFGGLIAAAPLRLGMSVYLYGAHEGVSKAHQMVRGSFITGITTFFFIVALWYTLPKYGLTNSFLISTGIWALSTVLIFYFARV